MLLGFLVEGVGCTLEPAAEGRRPPEALPPTRAAVYEPTEMRGLRVSLLDFSERIERYRFEAEVFEEVAGDWRPVSGEYCRARGHEGRPAPLAIVVPILGGTADGYLASRYISAGLAERGWNALFLHQDDVILRPDWSAIGLESGLRHGVAEQRAALRSFARLPGVDRVRWCSYGVSLGAIRNVVLLAAEPRLAGGALVLVGADLPSVLEHSREPLVVRYLAEREALDGKRPEAIVGEFRRWFVSDPVDLAPHVGAERAILVLARCDDKVPAAQGEDLALRLAGAAVYRVPLGHYTAVLAAPGIAGVTYDWLGGRIATVGATAGGTR